MSSSHTSPDVRRERRARFSRSAQGLALFATGALLGAGVALLPRDLGTARASGSNADASSAVAPVSGLDSSPSRGQDDSKANKAQERESSEVAEESEQGARTEQEGELSETRKARKPSEIARRALRFTAFVRGGNVYGAGILVDDQGHVLTCRHVIEGLSQISVSFADGATFEATVLDSDAELDLALLKISPGRKPGFVPASVTSVELGQDLYAIGAPRKMAFSMSRGMASYIGRPFNGAYYLQTDLAMNAGSSGGPVMNDRGEVIAISSFVLRDSEGLAFALPIDYAFRRFRKILGTRAALEGGPEGVAFEGWLTALGGAKP